jgi:hypothetical protein
MIAILSENIARDIIEGMERFDLQVKPFVINGSTSEKDLFWLCMPVSREKLTEVVRSRAGLLSPTPPFLSLSCALSTPLSSLPADESNNKYNEWSPTHIDKFLRCVFGGAQYKVPLLLHFLLLPLFFISNSPTCFARPKIGTDLWATEDKGMIRAPDFGRILSKDRFNPYLYPNPNPNPNL